MLGDMPRMVRLEYAGAIYHILDRGNRREDIFVDDADRHDFLRTLGEACRKTDWQVHAYCLMPNHFHLVLETPNPNLVAGMHWFLSTYTIRFNLRRKLVGHVFSGRYKALVVEGSGNGYLKTVCDYVHLNPSRGKLLGETDRLRDYPWSSFGFYLAPPEQRPGWLRVDRLLGEHGIQQDTAVGRQEFERHLEFRRAAEGNDQKLTPLRRGWCLGSDDFRQKMVELAGARLGESHAGVLRRETAEQRANRIIAEELKRLGLNESQLELRPNADPDRVAIAIRVREETTMSMKWIAARLHVGTAKGARMVLHRLRRRTRQPGVLPREEKQLGFKSMV